MSLHYLFPEIHLEPQPPKQPLSLWNPGDYWRLYCWLFHDPFTLDAYVQQVLPEPTMEGNEAAAMEAQFRSLSGWLWAQSALLLAIVTSLICATLIYWADVSYQPVFSPLGSYLTSLILGEAILFLVYLVIGVTLKQPANAILIGFFLGLILAVLEFYQLHFTVDFNSSQWVGSSLTGFNILTGFSFGVMLNTLIGVIRRNAYGLMVERVTVWLLMVAIVIFIISYNRSFALAENSGGSLQNILFALLAFGAGLIRPIDWFYSSIAQQRNPRKDPQWTAPRVTLLPTATTQYALNYWLSNNWLRGLRNASQVWKYTNLRRPVLTALHTQLHKLSQDKEQDAVASVAGMLAPQNNYGWTLDDLLANHLIFPPPTRANLRQWWRNLRTRLAPSFELFGSENQVLKPQLPSWHGIDLPLDTAADAALAGFYYLSRLDPGKAQQAFQKAGAKGMAKEMSDISAHLNTLTSNKSWLEQKSGFFKVEDRPEKPRRKDTWDALEQFKLMLEEAWLYRRCAVASNNRINLRNSVYDRLQALESKQLNVEEGALINSIARNWREPITRWFDDPERPIRPQKIDPNPFQFGQPLPASSTFFYLGKEERDRFGGLFERTSPILLHGQAGIGKTSLVNRLNKLTLAKLVPPVEVNLASLNLPNTPVSQQVLKMIGQQMSNITSYPPPVEHSANYLNRFHDFLEKACATDAKRRFTIVIDRLELALESGRGDMHDLIVFLSNLPVYIDNLRIIFAGRYIPQEVEELIRDNVPNGTQPFKLSFLDERGIRFVLNKPLEGVIARFQDDAVAYVRDLTNGQPFLVQLLAFLVVARFNERQREEKDFPDPVFTAESIDTAYGVQLQDGGIFFDQTKAQLLPFWKQAKPIFEGFLQEANRRDPQNTQLLRQIAHDDKGFSFATLREGIGHSLRINETQLQERLNELALMDLIRQDKESANWKIAIELFRIYLQMRSA